MRPIKIDPLAFILPLFILGLWFFADVTGRLPAYLFPGPGQFFRVLVDFMFGNYQISAYSGKLLENLGVSVLRVLSGFGLASFFGLLLGFFSGRTKLIYRLIDPLIQMIRTIPGIGWLPLALVWFGVGAGTTIFLIGLAAFFPIYLNVAEGAANISKDYLRAGRMLGANKIQLFKEVIIPGAFPSMMVGLRLGLGVSWAYLVLGEITGVTRGLGAILMDARMLGQVEMIPVAMVSIAILGVLSDRLLIFVGHLVYPNYEKIGRED